MLFSSTTFLYLFLPTVLFLYYIVLRRKRFFQNIILFFASLFFYAWGEPKNVFLMILSIVANWGFGLLVSRNRFHKKRCKIFVALSVVYNLSFLFVFKYLTFTITILNDFFNSSIFIPNIALPIGISFYTFQAMSYVIDVYQNKGNAQTNVLNVGLYISFFPQLVAGPIVRYETIAEEILNRKETLDDFAKGLSRFIIGLSKKVLLANAFAVLADQAFSPDQINESFSIAFSWLGAISYTFQIFYDFSGYSDMAIGLGRMFGFHFLENFNYPYISTSVSEFWRRWHISLGTWFKDYLYIPLGGSKHGTARTIFNLLVVWAITGLWHGANYTFLIWGILYFVLITAEKILHIEKHKGVFLNCIKWFFTIFFVIIGWVLFRSESISNAVDYYQLLFGLKGNQLIDDLFLQWFSQTILFIIIGTICATPIIQTICKKTKNSIAMSILKSLALVGLFILCIANLVSSTNNPFIYFNF